MLFEEPDAADEIRSAQGFGTKPIVVINKIDKPGARVAEVEDEITRIVHGTRRYGQAAPISLSSINGRDGIAKYSMDDDSDNLRRCSDHHQILPVPERRR